MHRATRITLPDLSHLRELSREEMQNIKGGSWLSKIWKKAKKVILPKLIDWGVKEVGTLLLKAI
jgi:hypothetical protein